VLAYDLRGHGQSARATAGFGLESMAADLEALLDGFAPQEPVALVGHSYGALIALAFALSRPARVARLALVEAPLPPWRVGELGELTAQGVDGMLRALPPALAGAVERGGRAARKLLERLQFLAAETTLLADLAAETEFDLDAPGAALARKLGALRVPTLCLYGSRSSCRTNGERLAAAIPGARLEILEGGHFLPSEAPQAVAESLERFLTG
jgi:pimeloyl-ACP methyl ester carboxylesterase